MKTAQTLSRFLSTAVLEKSTVSAGKVNCRYLLRVSGDALQLEFPDGNRKPMIASLTSRRDGRGRDPLLRAIGRSLGNVTDMTGGWCADAAHIARSGCRVTVYEKNPLIYVLSRHALDHCSEPELRQNITLVHGDSIELICSEKLPADIVYLDPMYPHRKNTAASPREITLLREIVGMGPTDPLADSRMLKTAMRYALFRVVVKRPHYAPSLGGGKVGEIHSKQVRFDIYRPLNEN